MLTLAATAVYRHVQLTLSTPRPLAFVDLTADLRTLVAEAGLRTGTLNVQTLHTTTGVVVNEQEPLLLQDFADLLRRLAPGDVGYRHDDFVTRTVNLSDVERRNGHAHCRALLLPSATSLNVADGELVLGRWQRVFFVELDGPQTRSISVVLAGEATR